MKKEYKPVGVAILKVGARDTILTTSSPFNGEEDTFGFPEKSEE